MSTKAEAGNAMRKFGTIWVTNTPTSNISVDNALTALIPASNRYGTYETAAFTGAASIYDKKALGLANSVLAGTKITNNASNRNLALFLTAQIPAPFWRPNLWVAKNLLVFL